MNRPAIIYTRVSTEDQTDGYSLFSQEELCRAYAAAQDYAVIDVIREVWGGEWLDRPGLNHLFDLAADRQMQTTIVFDIERLTRGGPAHYAMIAARLAQHGVGLAFVRGGYDSDSPESELFAQIQASMAWYDNQLRRERSVRGKIQAATNGKVLVGARPPYGYAYQSGGLVIVPDEAAIIQCIYGWAAEGVSTPEIARRLTAAKTPTCGDKNPAYARKNGVGVWGASTVTKILHNRTYTGVWSYGKTKTVRIDGKARLRTRPEEEHLLIEVPVIVEEAVFAAVQEGLALRRPQRQNTQSHDCLLQGRIYCVCGRSCFVDVSRNLQSYRCRPRNHQIWRGTCELMTYERTSLVDEAVWQALAQELLDAAKLRTWIAEWRQTHRHELENESSLLKAALTARGDVDRKLGILLDQMLSNDYAASILAEQQATLLATRQKLEKEIAALQATLDASSFSSQHEASLLELAEQLHQGLTLMDNDARRTVLDLLQVRVHMVAKQRARIEALLPLRADVVTWEVPPYRGQRRNSGSGGGAGASEEMRKGSESGIAIPLSAHYVHLNKLPPAHASHVPAP